MWCVYVCEWGRVRARVSEGCGTTCNPNTDSNHRPKLNMYGTCVRACVCLCMVV